MKELKLRPTIDSHDYERKLFFIELWLKQGDTVKLIVMFRGRESKHPELGQRMLDRIYADVAEEAAMFV